MTAEKKKKKRPPSALEWFQQIYRKSKNTESLVQDLHNSLGVQTDAERYDDPMEETLRQILLTLHSQADRLAAMEAQVADQAEALHGILSAMRGE